MLSSTTLSKEKRASYGVNALSDVEHLGLLVGKETLAARLLAHFGYLKKLSVLSRNTSFEVLNWICLKPRFLEIVQFRCHKPRLEMTKTELQIALAAATQTNKSTAGVFLDTLSNLAYKAIKKNGEFVLPGFGKLVKQKRKARTGVNPKTLEKIKIPAKTVVKFRVAKVAKDAILGVKK